MKTINVFFIPILVFNFFIVKCYSENVTTDSSLKDKQGISTETNDSIQDDCNDREVLAMNRETNNFQCAPEPSQIQLDSCNFNQLSAFDFSVNKWYCVKCEDNDDLDTDDPEGCPSCFYFERSGDSWVCPEFPLEDMPPDDLTCTDDTVATFNDDQDIWTCVVPPSSRSTCVAPLRDTYDFHDDEWICGFDCNQDPNHDSSICPRCPFFDKSNDDEGWVCPSEAQTAAKQNVKQSEKQTLGLEIGTVSVGVGSDNNVSVGTEDQSSDEETEPNSSDENNDSISNDSDISSSVEDEQDLGGDVGDVDVDASEEIDISVLGNEDQSSETPSSEEADQDGSDEDNDDNANQEVDPDLGDVSIHILDGNTIGILPIGASGSDEDESLEGEDDMEATSDSMQSGSGCMTPNNGNPRGKGSSEEKGVVRQTDDYDEYADDYDDYYEDYEQPNMRGRREDSSHRNCSLPKDLLGRIRKLNLKIVNLATKTLINETELLSEYDRIAKEYVKVGDEVLNLT